MNDDNEKLRKDILNRLNRIEGQVKGIHGMIEKNVCSGDVLVQISAIRSAINKVGGLVIENYANNCLGIEEDTQQQENLKKLIKTINTFVK
ncbi:metal-sensitive transcriptional regulator [Clostridium gasigenes]|uniref:DNA-binding transcriptional regulator, FrmR family n=1 Tax=Clostridium gasigenes TaxID=94869 RepID=A0A1H0UDQ2_9CLOT|nr:metal-sensitive transcriptional regulator [Clostridium gasigenes]MBB6621915.1 metal-sensitive transcriptional regulator [Clostridium gasigenes]MBB6716121.1 metal-sensitive transcriptional regulator [Clostridium gasigenes]MBU3089765.1 metal-sensitive transcriptional regulator [Clostridium gasigenes]MBU3102773.1 metal-sensitive transcriptional regulator [Clostridium gasigenes]MBU3106485.1 metal-sensitive transcriptional regulator [Clostridium gasigenes]